MGELHWTAEELRGGGWGIRYNPTPGGMKNADGSTTYSLSFIALTLSDMVSEPEEAARAISEALNADIEVERSARKTAEAALAEARRREAAYEASIADMERVFRPNKSRSWVLKMLRERLRDKLADPALLTEKDQP